MTEILKGRNRFLAYLLIPMIALAACNPESPTPTPTLPPVSPGPTALATPTESGQQTMPEINLVVVGARREERPTLESAVQQEIIIAVQSAYQKVDRFFQQAFPGQELTVDALNLSIVLDTDGKFIGSGHHANFHSEDDQSIQVNLMVSSKDESDFAHELVHTYINRLLVSEGIVGGITDWRISELLAEAVTAEIYGEPAFNMPTWFNIDLQTYSDSPALALVTFVPQQTAPMFNISIIGLLQTGVYYANSAVLLPEVERYGVERFTQEAVAILSRDSSITMVELLRQMGLEAVVNQCAYLQAPETVAPGDYALVVPFESTVVGAAFIFIHIDEAGELSGLEGDASFTITSADGAELFGALPIPSPGFFPISYQSFEETGNGPYSVRFIINDQEFLFQELKISP
ncbi:hypothetical protein KKD62_00325 [Patescibacteria group bacterium]|nr:hypothetical protein [Patescibacteria group bacterium]MBU1931803.1 hypothetical protein [Patescibacteria group bacterium]